MTGSTAQPDPREHLSRRAVFVWGAAVLFYIVAVAGRTSFGVAGVEAIERFQVDASRIAVFTAVQLGVYSLSQIPVGLLIDRYGSRKVLVTGALIMGVGQIILGLSSNYGVAVAARVLIGAGDATAFLSVMRLLPTWFPARLTPLFGQLTAGLGQLGQFISAVPFLALLGVAGWTASFVSLGAVGILIAVAAGLLLADAPASTPTEVEPGQLPEGQLERQHARFFDTLSAVLRHPVAWQGFFIHGAGMLNQIVFTLLWGVPLMTLGLGLSAGQAGVVLIFNTVATISAGPALGAISQRAGYNRDLAAAALSGLIGVSWAVFLLSEQPPSMIAAIVLNVIMAACTPSSNFGFDNVRARMDRRIIATGTGLGNMGGFLMAMVAAQLVGFSLDATSDGAGYGWADFRVAWLIVLAIWLVAVAGIFVSRVFIARWERGEGQGRVKIIDES